MHGPICRNFKTAASPNLECYFYITHIIPTIVLPLSSQRTLVNVNLWFKLRPNDRNTSMQHIPTLLAQHLQAPAKRSQHLNATDRNIVGRNMLHAFGHSVATCCDMLGILKMELVRMPRINVVARRLQHHATSTNAAWKIDQFQIWANSTQHVATRRNRVAKRVQHVAPDNVARYVALKCCHDWNGRGFSKTFPLLLLYKGGASRRFCS